MICILKCHVVSRQLGFLLLSSDVINLTSPDNWATKWAIWATSESVNSGKLWHLGLLFVLLLNAKSADWKLSDVVLLIQ